MGLDDKELSRIRALANSVVADTNNRHRWAAAVEARRVEPGARLRVGLRAGKERPKDPLSFLGDLADNIRNELRLERDKIGNALYGTSESTFTSGLDPVFEFDVWLL